MLCVGRMYLCQGICICFEGMYMCWGICTCVGEYVHVLGYVHVLRRFFGLLQSPEGIEFPGASYK